MVLPVQVEAAVEKYLVRYKGYQRTFMHNRDAEWKRIVGNIQKRVKLLWDEFGHLFDEPLRERLCSAGLIEQERHVVVVTDPPVVAEVLVAETTGASSKTSQDLRRHVLMYVKIYERGTYQPCWLESVRSWWNSHGHEVMGDVELWEIVRSSGLLEQLRLSNVGGY
jgi:hypothetical protein